MAIFIMTRYNNKKYPQNIPCDISEIAGHFDKKPIIQNSRYSLHTEYSYYKRKLDNQLLKDLNEIKVASKNGIPQLWKNEIWAKDFFKFIEKLLYNSIEPEIIEIHPPFIDYCNSINNFLNIYEIFEKLILNKYSNTKIFIENRYGTNYSKKFLISNCNDVINLCRNLSEKKLKLQIVLDYPQLMSSEKIDFNKKSIDSIIDFNNNIKIFNKYIGGIHLWGKKYINNRSIAHHGNLDTLFNDNSTDKDLFLKSVYDTFNDDVLRYMVLEVNSNVDDLHDIINDLIKYNFKFI